MNWKNFWLQLKGTFFYIFKILFSLATIIGFFYLFRWLGLKGFYGFALGLLIMAYMILSKNMIMQGIIDMTSSEDYIDELRGKTNEQKNNKKNK